jgi:hypothetical protein
MTRYRCWRCGSVNHDTDECPEITGRIGKPQEEPEVVRLDAAKCTDKAISDYDGLHSWAIKGFIEWAKAEVKP